MVADAAVANDLCDIDRITEHPALNLVPNMRPGEFADLKADIEARSIQVPVELTGEGVLLDGRHRLRAARELGLHAVPFRTVETDDAEAYVLKAAVLRRHLTDDQRTALAEKWRRYNKAKPGPRSDESLHDGVQKLTPTDTRKEAAEKFSVPRRKLEQVKEVADAAPELFEKVANGEVKLKDACKEVRHSAHRQQSIEAGEAAPEAGDLWQVHMGDMREAMAELPDASVDLIFTDPPYDDKAAALYGPMAQEAARVLKPGGSLLAYVGHNTLGPVLNDMGEHLRYWWTLAMHHKGPAARLPGKWVIVEWKPLVWFVKERRGNSEYVVDFIEFGMPEGFKEEHDWQQHEEPARVCIEKLTQPGDTVLDPFMGSGTTLLAAVRSGRRAIGIDTDQAAVEIAKGRLHGLSQAHPTS